VTQTQWSKSIKRVGIPLIEISDWTEMSLNSIEGSAGNLIAPSNIPAMWWPYWRDLIRGFIA
jgi:hypothetical protein